MQSSPERPGIVELSTFLMDEDDLTCRVHDTSIAEDGLLGAASIMMFITVAYISSDMSGVRNNPVSFFKDTFFFVFLKFVSKMHKFSYMEL